MVLLSVIADQYPSTTRDWALCFLIETSVNLPSNWNS